MQKKCNALIFKRIFCAMRSLLMIFSLLMSTTLCLYASPTDAQASLDKKISVQLSNATLKNAFDVIGNEAGVKIIFSSNEALANRKVSIARQNASVRDILQRILKEYALGYAVVDNYIVIKAATNTQEKSETHTTKAVLQSNNTDTGLPDRGVVGHVKNAKGDPLAGVSIIVVGTKRHYITGEDGSYSIDSLKAGIELEFTLVGFDKKRVTVADDNLDINVELVASNANLDEVVVTGFQNISKKKFTGAAVALKTDDIKIDGITDVSRMLQGRAAGVTVQNVSGTFGSAPKIRIRGATSINGSNKPLWVIDGVVLEDVVDVSNDQLSSGNLATLLGSSVAGLNVNDIESFDILKDASATSLYGARAMNGVVVVTTKKGRSGVKPLVTYNGTFGMQLKPSYSSFDIMNSNDILSVYAEMFRKGFLKLSELVNQSNSGIYGKLADLIQHPDANNNFAVLNTEEGRTKWLMQYANANTDWFGILFKNSIVQTHSLSIASGSEKSRTYFSTSYMADPGWSIADNAKRITAKFDNTYNFTQKLTVGFNIIGNARIQRTSGSEDRKLDPARGLYNRDFDINPFSYALNTSRLLPAYNSDGSLDYFTRNYAPFNIINETNTNSNNVRNMDVMLSGRLNYKILPGLSYEFLGSARYAKSTTTHEVKEGSNQAEAYRANGNAVINGQNPYLYEDPSNPGFPKIVVLPYGGFYNRVERELSNFTFRNSLAFKREFGVGGMHQIDINVGQEYRNVIRSEYNNLGVGFQYNNGGVPYNYYPFFKQLNEIDSSYYGLLPYKEHAIAFYGQASYTYDNKYTVTFTGRDDGSNLLLSPRTRWTPTWTVAGVWNADQENFIKNLNTFSHLSLRASYGLTAASGNATNSTAILRSKTTKRINVGDQQPSMYIDQLENGQLGLEKNYMFSTGLDMGFFNDRLSILTEFYTRHSFDLIGDVRTAGIGGQVTQSANYANMNSHGIDLTVFGKIVSTKNFEYTSQLNFGWNVSKITNLRSLPTIGGLTSETGGAQLGYPVRGLFSLQNAGLNPFNGTPLYINEAGVVSPAVNLGSISTQYLQYEGPTDPKIAGGFNNTFRYKGLSLSVFVTFQTGNKIRLTPVYASGYNDLASLPNEFKRRWTLPGDEKLTNIPSIAYLFTNDAGTYGLSNIPAYPYSNYNFSHDRVANGSFVRMQAITLSYKLPTSLLSRVGIKDAAVSLTGNNLFLIYADSRLHGQDPEFFNTGGVALPVNKQITGSLKITL